jgi:hypothetical protein
MLKFPTATAARAEEGPNPAMRFRVNSPLVISETIQGETIVINLKTGTYYSLQGTGAEIWRAIEREASKSEIVDELALRYEAQRTELETSVAGLLGELQAEELVAASQNGAVAASSIADTALMADRLPFSAPVFERHTDMQDIILLDPVHEVDGRGWPYTSEAQSV